jgi:CRP/FNR family transcriptional regulator
MSTILIKPHRLIFVESEPAENVFNVTDGAVKIYKMLPDGRRQITGFLFHGDFLGLVFNETYAYSAESLMQTKLCRFPRHKLESLLNELPKLEQRLLGAASHELAAAQDQMVLLGRKSARERMASFLLMLSKVAERHGQPDNSIVIPMSRADIGDYLGLTIETVSRTMTQFKSQGLIELLDDKQAKLLNLAALQEIAMSA